MGLKRVTNGLDPSGEIKDVRAWLQWVDDLQYKSCIRWTCFVQLQFSCGLWRWSNEFSWKPDWFSLWSSWCL